ncbi:MAG: polysaccharide deacetylase family protein [Thermomicrobiales bacterium]
MTTVAPRVTVVIPAYNEAGLIGRCLDSLAAQDFTGPVEVIVVDNGSTDDTATIAAARGVRVLHEARKGVCFARQAGTLAARAPYVANLDADSIADPDWLRRAVTALDTAPDVVAIAGTVDYLDAPGWAETQAVGFRLINTFFTRWRGGAAVVMASNLVFRRAAFDRVGGYDLALPTIGDEADFLFKLRRIGRVPFDPALIVRTSSRRFRRGLWHFLTVELGYQTIYAYILSKRFGRTVRRGRADIRDPYEGGLGERPSPPPPAGGPPSLAERERGPGGEGRPHSSLRWWLLGALALGGVAFFLATRPRSQLYGRTIVRGRTRAQVVALTFDDGPNEPHTARILDILRREGVPATFFLVGANVLREPALARRIVAEGHTIGNHTAAHRWRDAILDPRYRDLDRAQAIIREQTGVTPRYFRPPFGIHTPWQLRAVRRRGLLPVQWSAEANDPHRPGAATIARRLIAAARPGAIIRLHDGEGTRAVADRAQTVAALPAAIAGLRARGYRIVPLDEFVTRDE